MTETIHRIHKAELILSLDNQEKATAVQNKASELFMSLLSPIVEKVFNLQGNQKGTIIIDRLEIDLGTCSFEDQSQIANVFEQKLTGLIKTKLAEYASTKVNSINKVVRSRFDDFFYFLIKGRFPWGSDLTYTNCPVLKELLNKKWPKREIEKLFILTKSKDVQRRLIQLINNPEYLVSIHRIYNYNINDVNRKASGNKIAPNKKQHLIKSISGVLKKQSSLSKTELSELVEKISSSVDKGEDVITIINAGLVLCYPVFGPLFKELDLLSEDGYIIEDKKETAVHLLQFISSGIDKFDEDQATLAKLLCGYPLDKSILTSQLLSKYQKDKAQEALKSIIENWPILKDSSIAAFRYNFINRNAILKFRDEAFELHVEKLSIDILFEYNAPPWPISIVSLSWLKSRIFVNWF